MCPDPYPSPSHCTLQDATLAFLWSRMQIVDEIKDYARYTSFTWVDLLEALGRVADMKSLPLDSDLEAAGYPSILDWAIEKERLEGNDSQRKDAAAAAGEGDNGEGDEGAAASAAEAGRSGGATSPSGMGGGGGGGLFRARESAGYAAPKSRPLHVKLELLLDLIFRRLFWDPSQPESVFSHDGLLRMVKKVDKDMGP